MLNNREKIALKEILLAKEDLFYSLTEVILQPTHTKVPPGTYDVDQIIKSRTNFIRIANNDSQKSQKKTFVISDPTIAHTPNKELKEFAYDIIRVLVDAEFDVRVWNGSEAVKVSAYDDLDNLLKSAVSADSKVIETKLTEENIKPIATYHFEYFSFRDFLCDIFTEQQMGDLTELGMLNNKNRLYIEDIVALPKAKQIEFMNSMQVETDIAIALTYTNTIQTASQKIKIEECLKYLITSFPKIITELKINDLVDISLFADILKLENLEVLECEDASTIPFYSWNAFVLAAISDGKQFNFPKLTHLSLGKCNIPSPLLNMLSRSAPTLKILYLTHCTFNFSMGLKSFDQLQVLSVEGDVSGQHLVEILDAANNLVELKIQKGTIESFLPKDVELLSMSKLESIDVSGTDIPANTLAKLMSISPQLKEVHAVACTNLTSVITTSYPPYSVTLLDFAGSQIKFSEYLRLVASSPRVRVFDLSAIQLDDEKVIKELVYTLSMVSGPLLTNITKIIIPNVENIGPLIGQILRHAPNVEEISSSPTGVVENFGEISVSTRLKLPKLRKLNLSKLSLSATSMAVLIQSSENIEELSLLNCQHAGQLEAELFSPEFKLKNLRIFSYINRPQSLSTGIIGLGTYLQDTKAPISQTKIDIDLGNLPLSLGRFPRQNRFESVTEVILKRSVEEYRDPVVAGEVFASLLHATPNLEKLTISADIDLESQVAHLPKIFPALKEISIAGKISNAAMHHIIVNSAATLVSIELLTFQSYVDQEMPTTGSCVFPKLENFVCGKNLSPRWILSVLSAAPNLKHLKSSGPFLNLMSVKIDLTHALHHLESLELRATYLSREQLTSLLRPKLKKITLYNCTLDDWLTDSIELNELDELTIECDADSTKLVDSLSTIIMPNLKIARINRESYTLFSFDDAFLQLTTLEISNARFGHDLLLKLSSNLYPVLETLSLSNCQLDQPNQQEKYSYQFARLKTLTLNQCGDAEQILLHTPDLEEIRVQNYSQILFSEEDIPNLPKRLKKIDLQSVMIGRYTIEWILYHNPEMEKIILTDMTVRFSDLQPELLQLSELKSLTLNNVTISHIVLVGILTNAKQLQNFSFEANLLNAAPQYDYSRICQKLTHVTRFTFNYPEDCEIPINLRLSFSYLQKAESLVIKSKCDDVIRFTQPLAFVKKLHLKSNTLATLFSLLKLTPNVRELNVNAIERAVVADRSMFEEFSKTVKLVHLSDVTIDSFPHIAEAVKLFVLLLKISPNLITINLSRCGNRLSGLSPEMIPDDLQLPLLESIEFGGGNDPTLTPNTKLFFQKLCKCAPKLKYEEIVNTSLNNNNNNTASFFSANTRTPMTRTKSKVRKGDHADSSYQHFDELEFEKDELYVDGPVPNFKAKYIFISSDERNRYPDPSTFRLSVYPYLVKKGNTFKLEQNPNKSFIPVDDTVKRSSVPLEKQFKELSQNNPAKLYVLHKDNDPSLITPYWKPLPSLFSIETLLVIYAEEFNNFELSYVIEEDMYYIRSTDGRNTTVFVQYILDCGPKGINYLSSYVPTLSLKGACIARSIDCKDHLDQKGTSSRVVNNHIHTVIEIYNANTQIYERKDLGGLPANLQIEEMQEAPSLDSKKEPKDNEEEIVKEGKQEVEDTNDNNALITQNKNAGIFTNNRISATEEENLNPLFITWRSVTEQQPTPTSTLIGSLAQSNKRHFIAVENPDDSLAFVATFAAANKRPFIFIDSPDDLTWRSQGLKFRDKSQLDNKNELYIKKKFSELRDFVKKHPEGLIFFNWPNPDFTPEDVAALHCVLDPDRMLEGKSWPSSLCLVSFYAKNHVQPYSENDFKPRHDQFDRWIAETPIDLYANRCICIDNLPEKNKIRKNILSIDLFESDDWETALRGGLHVANGKFSLAESDFLSSLESEVPLTALHLNNAPWHLRSFQLFWQHALQQGFFSLYGRTYKLDPKFKLYHSKGYEWHFDAVKVPTQKIKTSYPLNSATYYNLFPHYVPTEGTFKREEGLLSTGTNQVVQLVVAENLSAQHWCRILAEAKAHQTQLELVLTEDASLPAIMLNNKVPYEKLQITTTLLRENELATMDVPCAIINTKHTTDTSQKLLRCYPNAMYIDLDSTHDFSDLIFQVKPETSNGTLSSKIILSQVWEALVRGETIIIEGELSPSLINSLSLLFMSENAEFTISGEKLSFAKNKGQIIFVTPTKVPFAKYQFSYSGTTVKPTKFVMPTVPELVDDPNDLSEEACEAFKTRRFNKIMNGFKPNKPSMINYQGPTGVGKTTYLLEEFEADYLARTGRKAKLYNDDVEAFAKHNNPNVDPYLLNDEANLLDRKISYLKGVNSLSPHLLINGRYYSLPANARVVNVGNPNSDGGVRQQEEFFEAHCQKVTADYPNNAYLYHEILKKQGISKETAKFILSIYHQINQIAGKLIISPRHLHIIAMILSTYAERLSGHGLTETQIIIAAILAVLGDSLPANKQKVLLQTLQTTYSYDENKIQQIQTEYINRKIKFLPTPKDFTFTASRYPILFLMDAYLTLRTHPNFQFGVLLEGSSGAGKSKLLKTYLSILGINFISFSWTSNYAADCTRLLFAYARKQIVLCDELNAGGTKYERLLNTMIMRSDEELVTIAKSVMNETDFADFVAVLTESKSTKLDEQFLAFGTENDITFAGRDVLPPAMKARFTLLKVPNYSKEELFEIFMDDNIERDTLKTLIDDFDRCYQYAEARHLEPKPNIRDLERVVLDIKAEAQAAVAEAQTQPQAQPQLPQPIKDGKQEEITTKPALYYYNKMFIAEIAKRIEKIQSKPYGNQELVNHKIIILNFISYIVKESNPLMLSALIKDIKNTSLENLIIPLELENNLKLGKINLTKYGKFTISKLLDENRNNFSRFFLLTTQSRRLLDRYSVANEAELKACFLQKRIIGKKITI